MFISHVPHKEWSEDYKPRDVHKFIMIDNQKLMELNVLNYEYSIYV